MQKCAGLHTTVFQSCHSNNKNVMTVLLEVFVLLQQSNHIKECTSQQLRSQVPSLSNFLDCLFITKNGELGFRKKQIVVKTWKRS